MNVSVYLARCMALQGNAVDLVTLEPTGEELAEHYDDVEGFSRVRVHTLGVRHTRSCVPGLIRYYRRHAPDVLFSQVSYTNVFAVLAKRLAGVRTRNVLVEGTVISKVGEVDGRTMARLKIVPFLVRSVYPWADGIVAKSPDVLSDLKEVVGRKLNRADLTVLPNPYVMSRFRERAREPLEHPWFQPGEPPVIVSVGRLWAQKGHDTLLRAFAEVQRERDARLVILGEGLDRAALEGLVRTLGVEHRVQMPGKVENPWKYMARATVFALASRWEGWPSAVMEAMACGGPVVTTDCPGGAKVMIEDGVSGLLVPTDDVPALASTLSRLLEDGALRRRLSDGARHRADHFDYTTVAGEYAAFGRSLVGAGGAS